MCSTCCVCLRLLICTAELYQNEINEDKGILPQTIRTATHTLICAGNIGQICEQMNCESQWRLELFAHFYCVKEKE